MVVDAIAQQDTQRWLDVGITCVGCGTQNLELWSTGQSWGDTVCVSCDETRVAHGWACP
jgi:hypothetical protein